MAKGPLAAARREATRLCSAIAKAGAHGWCLLCAPVRFHRGTDAAHIWAKSTYPGAEYEPDNLLWLARRCHQRIGSARMVGECEMRDLAVSIRGRERVEELRTLGMKPGPDVFETLAKLKAEAARLGIR